MPQLVTTTLAFLLAARLAAASPAETAVASASFESQGRRVSCEIVRPVTRGSASAPLVILLHGRSGPDFYAGRFLTLSARLARAGFVILVPRYFEATPLTAVAGPPEITEARFRAWQRALADAVTFGAALDGVDQGRIGVAGFSLGAYLALTQSAVDSRIQAVAANAGGLSERFPTKVDRMPPVLLIHAKGDPITSIESMWKMEKRLREIGVTPEVLVYDSAEHIVAGADWIDAEGRMTAFFRGKLSESR